MREMPRHPDPFLEDQILNAAARLWEKGGEKTLTMRAVDTGCAHQYSRPLSPVQEPSGDSASFAAAYTAECGRDAADVPFSPGGQPTIH
jgi:hypothetical protein